MGHTTCDMVWDVRRICDDLPLFSGELWHVLNDVNGIISFMVRMYFRDKGLVRLP